MSLRILAEGIAAPAYGQVFSFGVSDTIKNTIGIFVPGLPLFLASFISAIGFVVSDCVSVQCIYRTVLHTIPWYDTNVFKTAHIAVP